jgi:hypothetical protein
MAYGQNMNAPMSGLMGLAAMKGRMGDNTLVHVNPMELKALNAMAGPDGLTQNPSTGLPEAFKIKDILPILGAIAAPYAIPFMMGGAAAGTALTGLAGAAAAGGGAAIGAKLGGASTKEALTQGLASGVTAGMFGGLKGAESVGQKAAEETLTKGATSAASAPTFTSQLGQKALGQGAEETIAKSILDSSATGLTKQAALQSAKNAVGQQVMKQTAGAGLGAIAGAPIPLPKEPTYTPPSTVPSTQMTQTASSADIDRYIRQGGATPQFFNYSPVQIPAQFGGMAAEGGSMGDVPATYMAQGGDTGMFSGMVEAPEGDGMSDNVSFEVVGDPQIKQAMLSPDEYVMDAFTVAALGNGSSDAGAEKLDNFRLALREKVYGKEAQPKQVDGAKEISRLA